MASKSKRRGCALAVLLCVLALLFCLMVLRLVGNAKTVDWPEPAAGVDMALPHELVKTFGPTNGFYYTMELHSLRLAWPRDEMRAYETAPPLAHSGGTNIEAFVAANPKVAVLIRKAAATPYWRCKGPLRFDTLMPGVTELIQQAKFQCWVMADQARREDWVAFQQTAADQLAIADFSGDGFLIQELVSIAVYNIVLEELVGIASVTNIPPEVLLALDRELQDHEPDQKGLADSMRFECRTLINSLNDPATMGLLTGSGGSGWEPLAMQAGLAFGRLGGSSPSVVSQHIEAVFSQLVKEAEQSSYSTQSSASDWSDQLADDRTWNFLGDDPIARVVLMQSLPSYRSLAERRFHTLATVRGTRLVFAIERFRQVEGRQPRQLDELVPTYIDALPVDPYAKNGEALRGRLENGSWLIYSVGTDQIDDGGVLRSGMSKHNWSKEADLVIRPNWRMQQAPGP